MTSIIAVPATPVTPVSGNTGPAGPSEEVARPASSANTSNAPQPNPVTDAALQTAARQAAQDKAAAQQAAADQAQASDPVSRPPLDPGTRLDIEVEKDGGLLIKVRDTKTDKVVREIPPEELVEFGKRLKKYLGLLLDRRA